MNEARSADGERRGPDPRPLRRRVYELVEGGPEGGPWSRLVDAVLVFLILFNIAAFCAETVPAIEARWRGVLRAIEAVSVVLFTAEYGLRLWTSVEEPFLARRGPVAARLRAARRPAMLIDLAAILPFYLAFVLPLDLRVLRVLRLMRFLKLSRYSPALTTLVAVLNRERASLAGAGVLLLAVVLLASTGMYYIEGRVQPERFGSVPDAAWWAITTLTTVGYGDVTPVTPLGRLWGALTMVCGLCILALPVAIIATGFAQEAGRRDFVVTWAAMARIPVLARLDHGHAGEVMGLLHARSFSPGEEVIAAGGGAEAMFFVAAGEVEAIGDGAPRRYRAGDFFGTGAVLGQDENRASYRAIVRCRLLRLESRDFRRLAVVSPEVARIIREEALRRLDRDATGARAP